MQTSGTRNSRDEKLRRDPQLKLVRKPLNDEEKELFVVVREGNTHRAIEILNNPEVSCMS